MKPNRTKDYYMYKNESVPSISNSNLNISKTNSNNSVNKNNKHRSLLSGGNIFRNENIAIKELKELSLYITNIPSISEIKKTVGDFYKKNGLKENGVPMPFVSKINNISVKIDFPNENTMNDYKTYISYLKYENPLFKHIIIKKDNLFKTIKKLKLNSNHIVSTKIRILKNNNEANDDNEKSLIAKNIIKLYNHNRLRYKKDNHSFSFNTLSLGKTSDSDKIIINYYRNNEYLRNSSPYLSEEDKRIINEKENKKKFITPKGFCCSVGKYSCPPKYISNYVQRTPSENPNTYRFRPINKLKWMTKKGFINA